MAKITVSSEEFFDLIPLLMLTAMKNDELLDDNASEFFDDIKKKVLPIARQYYRAVDPALRRKLKFFLSGLESNSNTVITIKGDTKSKSYEQKYLTENYKSPAELAKKYIADIGKK